MSRNLRKSQRGSNHVRRSARLNALQSCQSQDKTSGNLKMMYIVFKDRMRCEFWTVLPLIKDFIFSICMHVDKNFS